MNELRLKTLDAFIHIFSGFGIGLLVGILLGLSVTPVVGIVVGSLAAVLAVFLGLKDNLKQEINAIRNFQIQINALRAGSFGVAVVLGILLGLYLRTNETLSQAVEKQVQQWTKAGYDTTYARQLVVYQKLGINPTTGEIDKLNEIVKTKVSALMSDKQHQDLCNQIDPIRYGNDPQQILYVLKKSNTKQLIQLAETIEKYVPAEHQLEILEAIRGVICTLKEQ